MKKMTLEQAKTLQRALKPRIEYAVVAQDLRHTDVAAYTIDLRTAGGLIPFLRFHPTQRQDWLDHTQKLREAVQAAMFSALATALESGMVFVGAAQSQAPGNGASHGGSPPQADVGGSESVGRDD